MYATLHPLRSRRLVYNYALESCDYCLESVEQNELFIIWRKRLQMESSPAVYKIRNVIDRKIREMIKFWWHLKFGDNFLILLDYAHNVRFIKYINTYFYAIRICDMTSRNARSM